MLFIVVGDAGGWVEMVGIDADADAAASDDVGASCYDVTGAGDADDAADSIAAAASAVSGVSVVSIVPL